MRQVLGVLLLLSLIGGAAGATDNKKVARDAYSEGTRLFELGDYQSALAAFKRAYLAYDEPSFLFNIGQCDRLLGDKVEALRSYKQYLRKVPNAPDRVDTERIVANLELAIEKEKAQAPAPEPPPSNVPVEHAPAAAAPTVVTPPIVVLTPPPPTRSADRPVYKKWWLWTIVGGVVVAGAAVGLGLALSSSGSPGSSSNTTLPAFGPRASQLPVRF